jgi:hydroxymethylpyrimidine/phosphomethylpyrimidine kinase
MNAMTQRPCVLVFAGHDPSGGAGIHADIEAIRAQGVHALTVITALTEQDNDRVYGVEPLEAASVSQKARTLVRKIPVSAIKIGIVGSRTNALAIAELIRELRTAQASLPVVLDPVLSSGHGDALALENAVNSIEPLLALADLITPNLPEAKKLRPHAQNKQEQAQQLFQAGCQHVLIKGGHGETDSIRNIWFSPGQMTEWDTPRLPAEFHGSGCTLASAIAAQLALGQNMGAAIEHGLRYTQQTLELAFSISSGQKIPAR